MIIFFIRIKMKEKLWKNIKQMQTKLNKKCGEIVGGKKIQIRNEVKVSNAVCIDQRILVDNVKKL